MDKKMVLLLDAARRCGGGLKANLRPLWVFILEDTTGSSSCRAGALLVWAGSSCWAAGGWKPLDGSQLPVTLQRQCKALCCLPSVIA